MDMEPLRQIVDMAIKWQYRRLARVLSTGPPEEFIARGERKLLPAFHRAAQQVPAYKRLLEQRGVAPEKITTVEEFKRQVPIIDKDTVFTANELDRLCVGGDLDGISSFYSSSGYSGVFSYGVETRASVRRNAVELEFLLDALFDIMRRKTLLINCLPMGVRINTRTLPVADTSVRADVVLALVKKLAGCFEQFILVGESPFLKKVIEEGAESGVPWHNLTVHVVTGGEFIAENFRSYLGHLLGIDPDAPDPERGMILVSMGLSELSLSVFRESLETIRLRRIAQEDRRLRSALLGDATGACPQIMQYHPEQVYIEAIPNGTGDLELVASMLDPDRRIPLIRYNTGDVVQTMGYDELERILRDFGYESLLPKYHLPVAIVWGRKQWVDMGEGGRISPDEVKECLYQDFDIAGSVTGNFRLSEDAGGAALTIQLRQGSQAMPHMPRRLSEYLRSYAKGRVAISILPYGQFPYALEHNYEKKNQYMPVSDTP